MLSSNVSTFIIIITKTLKKIKYNQTYDINILVEKVIKQTEDKKYDIKYIKKYIKTNINNLLTNNDKLIEK